MCRNVFSKKTGNLFVCFSTIESLSGVQRPLLNAANVYIAPNVCSMASRVGTTRAQRTRQQCKDCPRCTQAILHLQLTLTNLANCPPIHVIIISIN